MRGDAEIRRYETESESVTNSEADDNVDAVAEEANVRSMGGGEVDEDVSEVDVGGAGLVGEAAADEHGSPDRVHGPRDRLFPCLVPRGPVPFRVRAPCHAFLFLVLVHDFCRVRVDLVRGHGHGNLCLPLKHYVSTPALPFAAVHLLGSKRTERH